MEYSTIGYGFLLEETIMLLNTALENKDVKSVKQFCLDYWPQKSASNKEKLWQHMKFRFLEITDDKINETPFLKMYGKLQAIDDAAQDLIFYQLCISTPILLETLSSLVTDSFLNTGEAVFSRYHLDQLLERKYEHMPESTRDRIRSVLVKAGRLKLLKSNYSATTYCPSEAVLGYALYHDSIENSWRAPSTSTIISEGTIAPVFMCNKALLIAGINKLSAKGHCEYHRHGQTDQVQLIHQSLEGFVNAWK